MSDQLQNKVALTSALIQSQPTAKALLELEPVRQNWGEVYAKTTGRTIQDGLARFEAEKIIFLQQATGNKQLAECDKFSIYAAFTELAISGGSLRDGLCYIVPFKQKAVFIPGWKFRLEQINELPEIVHCGAPVVVYDCDEFDYEMGERNRIKAHRPEGKGPRTEESKPTHVYWVIEFRHGAKVYIMPAIEVYKIRDQYSSGYRDYVKTAKAQNVVPDGKTPVMKRGVKDGRPWEFEIELPMWIKDERQAFQKTIIKQVWKFLPKSAKAKWLDDRAKVTGIADLDPDEITGGEVTDFDSLLVPDGDATGETGQAQATGKAPAAETVEFEEVEKVALDPETVTNNITVGQAGTGTETNPDIPF